MGKQKKRSRLYFNQWGCAKQFSGGAFPTAFPTSICSSERKQPPRNLQNRATSPTRRNFPWETRHLLLQSEPGRLQERLPGDSASPLPRWKAGGQPHRKEQEVGRRRGPETKLSQPKGRCEPPRLKGAVGGGGKEPNCIQLVLSFPTRCVSLAGLTVSTRSASEPTAANCGPYIHTPRSDLTQCRVIGSSREQGETGIACELPLTYGRKILRDMG